jgi:hypothetical protein
VPADRREEDAAGAHPQHGGDVLDERRHPALAALLGEAPQERLDRGLVHAARGPQLLRSLRDEEVDREHGRADRRSEPSAARDPRPRLGVEGVDAHERPARPRHGGLRGERDLRAGGVDGAPHDVGRAVGCGVVGHVARHEAQLEARPRAAGEPLGDLVSLGSGLEQRDGGGASRHTS